MSPFPGEAVNRTERLYAIVEELRLVGPNGRSSTWLARRFGVSVRTIKRDVAALERAGTPVWGLEGRNGGYRLQRSAALPPLAFTSGEATALAIALAAEPGLPFGSDGRSALAKILGAMVPSQREAARDLARRCFMRQTSRSGDQRWTNVIDEALRSGVVVNLGYRDRHGKVTRNRPVEPMGLARTGGHWYLMGWCRRSQAGRWFRLDRIIGARPTTERCPERDLDDTFGEPPPDAQPVELGG